MNKIVYINNILNNRLSNCGIRVKNLNTIDKLDIVVRNDFNILNRYDNILVLEYLETVNKKYLKDYFKSTLIMNSF